MTDAARPTIECTQLHAGLSVPDLRAAIDFYVTRLGFFEAFTWGEPPVFAGVNLGSPEGLRH
jgi:catechol 2,3-dioxygenase-like lactoylglutathione lyase family enzyme